MATTLAPFQPGLASPGTGSTALTNTGGANNSNGGALATFTPGMDINQSGGNGASGPFASVQQMLQQPSVKKAMPLILIGMAILLFGIIYIWINMPPIAPSWLT